MMNKYDDWMNHKSMLRQVLRPVVSEMHRVADTLDYMVKHKSASGGCLGS